MSCVFSGFFPFVIPIFIFKGEKKDVSVIKLLSKILNINSFNTGRICILITRNCPYLAYHPVK